VQRLQDYANAFQDAISKALLYSPSVIVFGGDLLHNPRPDPKSMRIVLQSLIKLADSTQIVICIGNHEIEGHLSTTYTPLFSDLHKNIHVLTTENPHVTIEIDNKRVGFHGFQYLRNRKIAEDTLFEISEQVDDNDIDILCIHQAVERYLSPYEISISALREISEKYNLILLGHVHKHQKIDEIFDLKPAFYIGSTERISFNEHENRNGILIFKDFNFREPEFLEVNSTSMKQIHEDLDKKTPQDINSHIDKLININSDVKLLQINLDVEILGDHLDIRHDWEQKYPEFTILDVNVNPKLIESAIKMEKIEISDDIIREYFEKRGIGDKELIDLCIDMYHKYAK